MNAATFTAKMRSILSDNAGQRFIGGQTSGKRLDYGRLAKLGYGSNRVFKKPMFYKFRKYAVALLGDASGSMGWGHDSDKYKYAAASMTALAQGLKQAGAHVETSLFNRQLWDADVNAANFEEVFYERTGGGDEKSKSFCGGNHDAFALDQAALKLSGVAAYSGKILLVLSDGRPACDYCAGVVSGQRCTLPGQQHTGKRDSSDRKHREALIASIKKARAAGIVVLAVGIRTDAPVSLYGEDCTIVVQELNELYSKTAAMLEGHVVRG